MGNVVVRVVSVKTYPRRPLTPQTGYEQVFASSKESEPEEGAYLELLSNNKSALTSMVVVETITLSRSRNPGWPWLAVEHQAAYGLKGMP